MDLNLNGKSVVVTGGAKGMGYEIAKAFLKEGCRVCLVEIDSAALEGALLSLRDFGFCEGISCDVSSGEDVRSMAARAEELLGGVDILVNNAGVLRSCRVEDMEEADWDFGIDVNLKSVFLCTKAMIGPMKRRGGGVILNAASFAVLIPSVGHGAYGAAKTAVTNFTKVCAAELAPYGIRVLSYIPGVIATHLTAGMRQDPEKSRLLLDDIALNRFGEPGEVAEVVVFLASERAGYMTGSSVEIHGGKLCVQDPHGAYPQGV